MSGMRVGEVDPVEAWKVLENEEDSVLVDVRTRPEWSFVGTPDLSPMGKQVLLAEWRQFPGMTVNSGFVDDVLAESGPGIRTFLFICRSGARSMEAAQAVAQRLSREGREGLCLNVAEGFEGNLDSSGHRGTTGGWKARGLAWRQS
jgi:rhodanese-related sulfurtransferase